MKEIASKGGDGVADILLCIFLIVAGGMDAKFRKVKNYWLAVGLVLGLAVKGWQFPGPALLILILAFGLFRLRMMGAGDGKMMAIIAGYLGLSEGIAAIGLGLAAGVIWSLCIQAHAWSLRTRLMNFFAYLRQIFLTGTITAYYEPKRDGREGTMPLAACMAAGTIFYLCCLR